MRHALAAVAGALALAGGLVDDACACSCVQADADDYLAKFDAAFVGRLIDVRGSRPVLSSDQRTTYVFEVEKVAKGDLPRRVEVISAADGASCGIEAGLHGDTFGLFLEREGAEWHSGLCLQVRARELEQAAARAGIELAPPTSGDETPAASSRATTPELIAAGAVGAALALGIAVVLRRRGG